MEADTNTLMQMQREYPDWPPIMVKAKMAKISRLAAKHDRACQDYCNIANFDPKLIDAIEARIDAKLDEEFPGTTASYQHDPRGATVKLVVPSGATNDWGREGLCVLA